MYYIAMRQVIRLVVKWCRDYSYCTNRPTSAANQVHTVFEMNSVHVYTQSPWQLFHTVLQAIKTSQAICKQTCRLKSNIRPDGVAMHQCPDFQTRERSISL